MHWYSQCSSVEHGPHVYSTVKFPKSFLKNAPEFCSSIEHTLVGYTKFLRFLCLKVL